ncbi:TetR/AcrR family transcriptional regulator [Antrihabitans stalactiti]|uniref:TetR/AcrR family transcriptional regulator n=1 Tax=Antrihabitans stalactiti TaxID=2584121 RepID=A0A848KCZ6_9NOCA|nr:TetR/AcrR family transcriptional regulator [Antrihabitans stalactiti]NMN93917.1 TetR/AcrR family transcriptional regulator [Antrihabitans stalactiti]
MSEDQATETVPERLIRATIELIAQQGPSAIKARSVASASGLSTMVVYHHFGGIPELMRAVVDQAFTDFGRALADVPVTDDPVADLFAMALTCRDVAQQNPHLYDLMFGLSTRATYRPLSDADLRLSGHSPAFQSAYVHLVAASERLVNSGRICPEAVEVVAAQLWSFVHGYVTLELAGHFTEFDDPAGQVLLPMGITFAVGLGDTRERATISHAAVVAGTGLHSRRSG